MRRTLLLGRAFLQSSDSHAVLRATTYSSAALHATGTDIGPAIPLRHIDSKGSDEGEQLVLNLRALLQEVHAAGGAKAVERHRARNKMLPRERVSALLDAGSTFLELSPFAGHGLYGMHARLLGVPARAVPLKPHHLKVRPFLLCASRVYRPLVHYKREDVRFTRAC